MFCELGSTRTLRCSSHEKSQGNLLSLGKTLKMATRKGVPVRPLKRALKFLKKHPEYFPNKRFITVANIGQHATERRLYIVDRHCGHFGVRRTVFAHSKLSENYDPKDPSTWSNLGWATDFSNVFGLRDKTRFKNSLGFFTTLNEYHGSRGRSLRLTGLSKLNSNAYARLMVLHQTPGLPEDVRKDYLKPKNHRKLARLLKYTEGCIGVPPKDLDYLVKNLQGGSLLYVYYHDIPAKLEKPLPVAKVQGLFGKTPASYWKKNSQQ